MLIRNYHTHTYRCGHATGSEREYIEAAIKAGIRVLGISDHAPYIFKEGYYSQGIRMRPEELPEYTGILQSLKKEYKDDIEILIGLEAEYSFRHFDAFLELIKSCPLDYLILGQHYVGEEYELLPPEAGTDQDLRIASHMKQMTAGIRTGLFSYVAHPDMQKYNGDDETYAALVRPFCEEAKRLGLPLEINLLGIRDHRNYPSERFFRVAGEVGNTVIIGCDAHSPDVFAEQNAYPEALRIAEKYHLPVTDRIKTGLLPH